MTTIQRINGIDVSQMEELKTGDPHMPTIYIDRNCQVFIKTCIGDSVVLRHALTPEIRELAERYGLDPLWRAIRQPESSN